MKVSGVIVLHFQTMKEHGVTNFVFSSSATVYGPPQKLPLDEDHPIGQGITNPYGQTKFFIEQILRDLAKAEPVSGSLIYLWPVTEGLL